MDVDLSLRYIFRVKQLKNNQQVCVCTSVFSVEGATKSIECGPAQKLQQNKNIM